MLLIRLKVLFVIDFFQQFLFIAILCGVFFGKMERKGVMVNKTDLEDNMWFGFEYSLDNSEIEV